MKKEDRYILSKEELIRKKSDYASVFSGGSRRGAKGIGFIYKQNDLPFSRLGLVVKKTTNSVERNRTRRIIKEVYRRNKHRLKKGIDIVVSAKGGETPDYGAVEKAFLRFFGE